MVQIATALIAIVLNVLICICFRKNRAMRKKNANILLFNQALVDLVNCAIFAIPNAIFLRVHRIQSREPEFTFAVTSMALILSGSSSVFLFALIAVERFLSLYKPMWHRVHVTTGRIWKGIVFVWAISVVLAVTMPFVYYLPDEHDSEDVYYKYRLFLFAILVILIISITVLHIWSFVLAYRATHAKVKAPQQFALTPINESPSTNEMIESSENPINRQPKAAPLKEVSPEEAALQLKKQFRLLKLFIVMYIAFLVSFSALSALAYMVKALTRLTSQSIACFFIMTSLLNPVLTFCLKPEFRPTFS